MSYSCKKKSSDYSVKGSSRFFKLLYFEHTLRVYIYRNTSVLRQGTVRLLTASSLPSGDGANTGSSPGSAAPHTMQGCES